jgi:hypothetical protein
MIDVVHRFVDRRGQFPAGRLRTGREGGTRVSVRGCTGNYSYVGKPTGDDLHFHPILDSSPQPAKRRRLRSDGSGLRERTEVTDQVFV